MLVVSPSIGFIKALITPLIKLHSGTILRSHLKYLIQNNSTCSHVISLFVVCRKHTLNWFVCTPPPFLTFSIHIHSDCHIPVFRMVKEGYSDLETLEKLYLLHKSNNEHVCVWAVFANWHADICLYSVWICVYVKHPVYGSLDGAGPVTCR